MYMCIHTCNTEGFLTCFPESGAVYSWGDGRKGQLGHGEDRSRQLQPKRGMYRYYCQAP